MKNSLVQFQKTVWNYYRMHARNLSWRHAELNGQFDAYKILVSEVMLQQTQVPRVIPKYEEFLKRFPSLETLAAAPLGDVLRTWSGLGYNRRAKYLWEASKILNTKPEPWIYEDLVTCPGIGPNTARAIMAYTYNLPVAFIETNIRTVFIHHFFVGQKNISDGKILSLVQATLDHREPRTWFYALMDYGSYLKSTVGNLARASKAYTKQAPFQGSNRQIRGHVLRVLGRRAYYFNELQELIVDDRLPVVLSDLVREGFISYHHDSYKLV